MSRGRGGSRGARGSIVDNDSDGSSGSSSLDDIFDSSSSASSGRSSRGGSRGTRGGIVDDGGGGSGPGWDDAPGSGGSSSPRRTVSGRSTVGGVEAAAPASARSAPGFDGRDGGSADRIDAAAQVYTERIADPFGDVVADATPVTAVEERTLGTSRSRDFFGSAGSAVAELGNVPAFVSAGRTAFEARSQQQDTASVGPFVATAGIPSPEGQDEVGTGAAAGGAAAASAAADNPFAAAGTATGAVLGGFGVAGGAQRLSRSGVGTGSSTFDVDDFIFDTRAQTGGRRRGTQREQESITIERMADEQPTQRTGPAELEDIPGVTVERRGSQRQQQQQTQQQQQRSAAELEDEILQGLDELGIDAQTGATTTTARTQAGTATPPFATGAEASAALGFGGATAVSAFAPVSERGAEEATVFAPEEMAQGAFAGMGAATDTETTTNTTVGDHDLGGLGDTTTGTQTGTQQTVGTTVDIGATTLTGTQTVDATATTQATETGLIGQTATASDLTTGTQAMTDTPPPSTGPPPRPFDEPDPEGDDDLVPFDEEADDDIFGSGIASVDDLFNGDGEFRI